MYKMAILIRKELKMPKGKLSVQVAHAAVECAIRIFTKNKLAYYTWKRNGAKKIVLKSNLEQILELKKKFDALGLVNSLISDAGLTVLEPGTITALGVFGREDVLDQYLGGLKLL